MFDSLIREIMVVADTLSDSLQATIQIYPWIGVNDQGGPNYGTAVSVDAIVEEKERRYTMKSGQEIVQRAKITIPRPLAANGTSGRHEPIDTRDKIVLPSGYTGPILWVEGVTDPSTGKKYFTEVVLG